MYIQDLIPGPGWFGIRVMLRKHNIQIYKRQGSSQELRGLMLKTGSLDSTQPTVLPAASIGNRMLMLIRLNLKPKEQLVD